MPSLKRSDVVAVGSNSITQARSEDGLFYVHTEYYDDVALERNKQIASSGMLANMKLGLHDDEDVRMVISCPSTDQWILFKRKNPETYKLLVSTIEAERMKGARQLQILHPAWVVQSRL